MQVVRGEGFPKHQFPSERGDLFIEYSVAFPANLTEEQRGRKLIFCYEQARGYLDLPNTFYKFRR